MAIWALADLVSAIGARAVKQCLDDDGDGQPDAAALASVQRDADAMLLGYLCTEYSAINFVPPAAVPDSVKMLGVNIGCHIMYERRPEFLNEKGESPASGRCNRAIGLLKELKKSGFRLDTNGSPQKPLNVSGEVRTGTFANQIPVSVGFVKDGTGDGGF